MSLPSNMVATIYGIRDDRDGLYRWVGRTSGPLRQRLWGHKATRDGTLYLWLIEARDHVSIHELGTGDAAIERNMIERLHKEGHPLHNKVYLHGWPRSVRPRQGVLKNRLCR